MYRVFCESYRNFLNLFGENNQKNEYRYQIVKPFKLICDTKQYKLEKEQDTTLFKQLSDLLFYMEKNIDRYPKIKAFLWTLEGRGIKEQYYGVAQQTDLEEQIKLANMFLNLLYW